MADRSQHRAAPVPAAPARSRATAPGYVLTMLTIVSFFNFLDRSIIAVLIEPIKRDLDLSDSQLGLIAGFAFAMLYATLGLPLARIADRRSRITLMSISIAVWSVMTALTGMARNFIELFVARVGVGVGEAGCNPAAHSLIGDLFPAERRAFAVSIFQAGGMLGQTLGLMIAALVAQYWGWRAALMLVGLCGVPVALLLFSTVREPARSEAHAAASAEPMSATVKALLARRPLVHLILGIAIASFGSQGITQWGPSFFIRTHGLKLSEVGVLIGLTAGLGAVLGMVMGGWVMTRLGRADRRWELWMPAIVFALNPFFMMPSFLLLDLKSVLLLQFLGAFISASGVGVAISSVQTYSEPHRRATAAAIMFLMSALIGLGLGPVAVGVLSDVLKPSFGIESLRYALLIMSLMPFWAATHLWLASRSSARWRLS